jgi:transcriptional regulator with XRE-family HTH domain
MSEHSTLIIAKNVKLIREALGLSQKDFAILSSISRASLIKMEAGNSNYNIKLLHSILSFAQFDLAEISKSNFKIFDGYRDKLIKMYFKDLSKRIILENQPTLVTFWIGQKKSEKSQPFSDQKVGILVVILFKSL